MQPARCRRSHTVAVIGSQGCRKGLVATTIDLDWTARADVGQASLDHFFGAAEPQLLNNTYPAEQGDNATFNYWWLAHVIDVRLDAFARTGDAQWLRAAERVCGNIRLRNGGSIFNDYFDDMLWYGLAILRLRDASGHSRYLDEAQAIWAHVVEFGWNDQQGYSMAWRKQQLHYKNTPANGPFVILSCRLAQQLHDPRYQTHAQTAYDWLTDNLVHRETGFVEDGLNREQDGRIDTHWRFTYNQGLYIGAAVELSRLTGNREYLQQASRTALTAIEELGQDGLFRVEGDGGDEGLFKGIYYRYVGLLLADLDPQSATALAVSKFIRSSTGALWENSYRGDAFLAGNDWANPPSGKLAYSTQLSAIMALEVRARLEAS